MLLTNIKNFIKKYPFLFWVFIITQIISVVGLQYAFFGFRESSIEMSAYSQNAALFTVKGDFKGLSAIESTVEKLKTESPFQLNMCYFVVKAYAFSSKGKELPVTQVRAYFFGENQSLLYGRKPEKSNEIIIPHSYYERYGVKIGDEIQIDGKAFLVCGVRMFEYSEILVSAAGNKTEIEEVSVETKVIPSKTEKENMTAFLYNIFPKSDVSAPHKRDMLKEYTFDNKSLASFVLLALSMVNISYIFKVVLEKRKKYYSVLLCCGCAFGKMRLSLLFENLCYGVFSVFSGTIFFNIFLINILFSQNRFSRTDYVVALLFSFLVVLIPVVMSMIGFSSKSIKQIVYEGK